MKSIIFQHRIGPLDHEVYTEEFEFNEDATVEEINEKVQQWSWEQVEDNFSWYEKA